jgi:hypothetical protein
MERVIPEFDGRLMLAAAKQGQRHILVTCSSEDLTAQTDCSATRKDQTGGPLQKHKSLHRSREVLIQFHEEYKK